MRAKKGSRRIVVANVEYRWRASGNDGYISIVVWPSNNVGGLIEAHLRYHETWTPVGPRWTSDGDQIVVTGRVVRQIIEHATTHRGYKPGVKGKLLNLRDVDDVVRLDKSIRATKRETSR